MTQLPLFNNDPVHNLMLMGYSEREAAFLRLAGLHSGFFLRRQYCQFTGIRGGRVDTELVEKLLTKDHATAVAGCHKTVIYHLGARPFYAALTAGDNRNRRIRPAVSIKNRLMGLDYVLDHPGPRYLATEQEKISYFTRSLGIAPTDLPSKSFRSPGADNSTTRFFVDKHPIFLREEDASSSVVGFCFVDEGLATCSRFEAYLHQYRGLFSQLASFEVIYVAASRNLFWEAENLFKAFARGVRRDNRASLAVDDLARLLGHFEDRERSESGLWDSFDRAKLIRLREEREEFSGSFFDSLYNRWKAGNKDAVLVAAKEKTSCAEPLKGTFSAHVLRHNYDVFGSAPEAPND
jgi:hypothetical protein